MNEGTAVATLKQQLPVRQEFGAMQTVEERHETAATAVAAQAKAMVESRYVMALKRPRNWDQVRQDILKECRRPSFAANPSSFYKKPIGKGVEGLGIRFAEVAVRCMSNVLVETPTIYEDDAKRIVRVLVTDLESNTSYTKDIVIAKTVERSKPMDDGSYISVRMNSYNKPVYTVPATDDDLLNKENALISKAIRSGALRILPGDIQDEAEEVIKATRNNEAARDPDAERKKIADAFAGLGVRAVDLESYLGHGLDTCTPAELVDLRGIYGAVKDGEATWKSVMENKAAEGGGVAQQSKQDTKPARGVAQQSKERTQQSKTAQQGGGSRAVTYEWLKDRMEKATDVETLDLDADLIREVEAAADQDTLRDIYKAQRAKLASGK